MITKTIQINEITFDELADKVADKLLLKIEDYLKRLSTQKDPVLLTRQEVSEYLRVSSMTIHMWSKKGILSPVRIGNRVFYKKQDIITIINRK